MSSEGEGGAVIVSRATVRMLVVTVLAGALGLSVPCSVVAAAAGADSGVLPYDQATTVGVHNTYEKSTYPYLVDALDAGTALVELDVWTNAGAPNWRVAHMNPLANDNNCVGARTIDAARTGPRDRDFGDCLGDLRAWHDANPGHRPVLIKVELKDGFTTGPDSGSAGSSGGSPGSVGGSVDSARGPAEFDALVRDRLGDAVFGPADLLGEAATLDEAVRERGWPTRDELAGRFVIELIPGPVEEYNPLDDRWTDRVYAEHLRDLAAAGRAASAAAFPAVHGAAPGDPRLRYADATLRPWFVVFDGDASAYLPLDTEWYARNHYLLVMTDAHQVPPLIDGRSPDPAAAAARVRELADRSASVVTSDWAGLPTVLTQVEVRR